MNRLLNLPVLVLVLLAWALPSAAAQSITDPDRTFQMTVPAGWIVSQTRTPHSVVLSSTARPGTQVTIQYLPGTTITDDAWVEKFRAALDTQMPGVKWGAQSNITVGGQPAIRLDLTQKDVPMSFILVRGEQKSWLVTVVANSKHGYDKMLSPVLEAVRVL